jgi:transposase-like protein
MLNTVSDYLNQSVDGIDTTIITLLLEELNNISNGNEAKFIKSKLAGGGRPIHAGKNARQAALCAAIQILCDSGIKTKQAVERVAKLSGVDAKQLSNLRQDFRKGNKARDTTDLMKRWVKQQKEQRLDPEKQAVFLVEAAQKIGE